MSMDDALIPTAPTNSQNIIPFVCTYNSPSPYIGNKKNYNMIHHVIIGGCIDVYIVVRFVWF